MEKFLDRRYGASWIDSPKRIRRLLYANRHHSRKAGLVRRVIPAAPHASALPACGALRVIFNSLKVPLSTSVLSHDGALLDGVVSDWEPDIASKGHQTSITYLLIQRNAVENLSKLR